MKSYLLVIGILTAFALSSCAVNPQSKDSSQSIAIGNSQTTIQVSLDDGSAKALSRGISISQYKVISVTIQLADSAGDVTQTNWTTNNSLAYSFTVQKFGMNTLTIIQQDESGTVLTDSKQFLVQKGYNYKITVTLGGDISISLDDGSQDQFTVAVIPDTQNYCDVTQPQPASIQIFQREMQYLASQKNAQNIAFVADVGDVVQHGDLYDGEWTNAASALNILSASGIPFGMSPGNHDYDNYSHLSNSRPLSGSVKWNQYFGPNSPYFSGKPWYGTSTFHGSLSSYQTFTAAGITFLHISLEMEAADDALAWAASIISNHPGLPTIVTTHEYLSYQNDTNGRSIYLNDGYMAGEPNNNVQQVWDKFISQNDQIFLVICGHNWSSTVNGVSDGENLRIDNNNAGHPVYQVLSDYQGNTFDINGTPGVYTGGAGWLRLMKFDMTAMTIHFQTYSSELGVYAGVNGGPTFNIDPSLSDFILPIPDRVVSH